MNLEQGWRRMTEQAVRAGLDVKAQRWTGQFLGNTGFR